MRAVDAIWRAATILQDTDYIRWPVSEQIEWLNDGQREMVRAAPVIYTDTVTLPLAAGAGQSLPAAYERLVRPLANARTDTSGRARRNAVTLVDRALLDAVLPSWADDRRVEQQVKHVMLDPADPRRFWVYPANDGSGQLSAVVIKVPVVITSVTSIAALMADTTDLGFRDIYLPILVDYLLYRALAKDTQYAGSAERAAIFFRQFTTALTALNPAAAPAGAA